MSTIFNNNRDFYFIKLHLNPAPEYILNITDGWTPIAITNPYDQNKKALCVFSVYENAKLYLDNERIILRNQIPQDIRINFEIIKSNYHDINFASYHFQHYYYAINPKYEGNIPYCDEFVDRKIFSEKYVDKIIKAKVITFAIVDGGTGYMIELTHGNFRGPKGEIFKPGDSIYCFNTKPVPYEYCAYFQIGNEKECEIGAFEIGLLDYYNVLPVQIVYSK